MNFYGIVDGTESSLKHFLSQLPGVDQVGAVNVGLLILRSLWWI
jgi:deoxyribose-phosphate aldolase